MNNWTIAEAAQQLHDKKISAQELTEQYLKEIKASDLNAFITVDETGALKQAKKADELIAKQQAQNLTGIPMGIKDAIVTANLQTTSASRILEGFIPPYNATVIDRLQAQGVVILGKNNLDEFAMGASTENSAYGVVKNPIDINRVPGGSSGGSAAAVAANLCIGSLGSDTGGSIRQPAGFCGITGFKPTYGRVSRYGLIAMASSLDQIGPLAKTAEDAKIIFETITGHDKKDATSSVDALPRVRSIKDLTIGLPKEFFDTEGLDPRIKKSIESSLKILTEIGCKIKPISLPTAPFSLAVYYIISPVEVASNMGRYDGIKYGQSVTQNVKKLTDVYSQTRARYLGSEVKRRIILGSYASSAGYYDAYYGKAEEARRAVVADFNMAFKDVDLIAGPTSPTLPFKIGERSSDPLQMYLSDIYTVPVNIAGLPGISIPSEAVDRLPVGLQLIGPRDSDLTVLEAAIQFQNNSNFHHAKY